MGLAERTPFTHPQVCQWVREHSTEQAESESEPEELEVSELEDASSSSTSISRGHSWPGFALQAGGASISSSSPSCTSSNRNIFLNISAWMAPTACVFLQDAFGSQKVAGTRAVLYSAHGTTSPQSS